MILLPHPLHLVDFLPVLVLIFMDICAGLVLWGARNLTCVKKIVIGDFSRKPEA
jgi:hypothetical protein